MSDWRLAGLCRDWDLQAVDRLWFADVEDPQARAVATAICQRCPARNPCAAAGRDEEHGIFGGLDPGDRGVLQILATPMPEPEEIHDRARYVRGCRCGDCKRSNASYVAEWRDRPVTERGNVVECEQMTLALM